MADEQRQPNQRAAEAPGPQPAPAQPETETEDAPSNPYRVPLQPPTPGQTQPGQEQPPPASPPGHAAPGSGQPGYAQPGYGYPQQPGYQGQQPYPYPYQAPPYQQAPYQQGYPYAWSPGQPVRPRTEPQAVLALVLAIMAWLVIPLGPAFLALVVAYFARNSILASHGARRGLGLVSAARWVATIHLIVLPVGAVLWGKLTLTGVLF